MTMDYIAPWGLLTRPPFSTLFAIDTEVWKSIVANMQENGFDEAHPIDVWEDGDDLVVVDGHTRLKVARTIGIDLVPVFRHPFDDQLDALKHAFNNQTNRRNLKGSDLVNAIRIVDEERRKSHGGDRGNQYTGGKVSRDTLPESPTTWSSKSETAAIVGTSEAQVGRARAVYDDPIAMQEVEAGVSLDRAAKNARARKRSENPPKQTSANGHTSEPLPGSQTDWTKKAQQPRRDDEPWFKAMDHGAICQAICRRAASDIRHRLEIMAEQELDLVSLMSGDGKENAKVRAEWSRALDEARTVTRLIRKTIQAARIEGDE